jgi:hypothetical protein
MEDLANLFADEALAEKRFSRPRDREAGGDDVAVAEGGDQPVLRSEGRSKGAVARDDVAASKVGEGSGLRSEVGVKEGSTRDDVAVGVRASLQAKTGGEGELGGDDVASTAGMTSEAGVSSGRVGEGRKGAEREGVLSAEAAAVLTPPGSSSDGKRTRKVEAETGTVRNEKPPEPNPGSASGRELNSVNTESERRRVSGSKSAGPAEPGESIGRLQGSISEGASTVFLDEGRFLKQEDASIEEKAASLGLFQEVGPDSKVSTFEAPSARRESESVREREKQEWAVSEGFRNSGFKSSEDSKQSGGWLGQKVAKLGSDGGLGLEEAVKAAVGEHLGAEKRVKRGAKKDRGLSRAFEEGFKALKGGPGSGGLEESSGKGRRGGKRRGLQDKESVKESGGSLQGESGSSKTGATVENEEGRDSGAADEGSKPDRKVSNPFLTQTMAASASRVASSEDPETPSRPFSPEETPSAEPLQNLPNPDKPSGAEPPQEPLNPGVPLSANLSQNPPNPGKPSSAGSTRNPLNPEESSSSRNPNPEPASEPAASSGSPRKKKDYPEWMPPFMDKIHPDSPNFDPELYAKTHPIKRAMMDDDSEGRFPDFSLEALQGPAPETSRPLEEGDPESEFSPETHPDNVIDEALNVTEEQRARVLEAANAEEFEPAAYDKTAPPWEAFRGFGVASRDLEGYDVEGTRDLREQDQEFDIPVKGGGTKRVKIPAGGFKNEEELNAAFKGERSTLENRVKLREQPTVQTPAAST